MKEAFKVKAAKVMSAVLVAAMTFALIPKFIGNDVVLAASGSKNQDNTSLGVSAIVNPTPPENEFSPWTGSFVYFGKYTGTPLKFRVLQKNSDAHTESEALFLDCDVILKNIEFGDTNQWPDSSLKKWLNEDFFTSSNFTSIEMAAVPDTKTEEPKELTNPVISGWFGKYVPLSGEKVFVLDAEEVTNNEYGYSSDRASCVCRKKVGARYDYWWLRSAVDQYGFLAGDVYVLGDLSNNNVELDNVGASPALNVDQGSIVFTTKVAGENNAYKLTLSDSDLTIAVPDGKDIDVTGTNVTVPYEIGGSHAGNATRASVLITDDTGDNILFYDELGASSALDGTFPLPDGCDLIGWGNDYHVYILAEDINGEKETDYASEFVRLDKPAKIHEISVNVTTYDSDGKTKISETGGTATVSAASAVAGDKITVTAAPESGYTLKSITWGDGKSSTDITYPKEFTVKDSDAVVEVIFEKEVIIKDQSNTSLGVTAIVNPTQPGNAFSPWTGSFVYFGKYIGTPLKFRVLQKDSTAHTESEALFLDCDVILRDIEFGGSNKWSESYIKKWLDEDFFTSANFTQLEADAVPDTKTEQEHDYENVLLSNWYGKYVPLSGEKAFVLDAEEATNIEYGYSSGRDSCACRRKVGGRSNYWWLRSAVVDDFHNTAGDIYVDGDLSENDIRIDSAGIAPALNVDQGSIVFTTKVANEDNAYKLTLSDSDLTIAVPDGKNIDVTRTNVTVPYEIGGSHAGNATRASILITDEKWDASGATIKLYDELGTYTDTSGAFALPTDLDLSGWGTDYHVYILAENINGEKETDYASAFVELSAPNMVAVNVAVNVMTYDSDGVTLITDTPDIGGTASVDPTTAVTGDKVTVTATPNSGYTLNRIEWGNGLADGTDITDTKAFTVGDFKPVVDVYFQKEAPVTYTVTVTDDGNGTGTATPASGATGTEVALSATPSTGYQFKEWVITSAAGGTIADPTSANTTYTIGSTDVTIQATFETVPVTAYTVTVNSGSADVTSAAQGTTVTLTADANPTGKEFDKWVVDSGTITLADVSSATTTFTMPAEDVEVTATYKDIVVTAISIATPGKTAYTVGDSLGVSGMEIKVDYSDGSSKTIPVTTAMVSGFDSSAAAASQTLTITYEGKTTTYNVSISAVAPTTYTVTFNTNGGSAVASQTVAGGSKAVKPDIDPTKEGFAFDGWYQDATFTAAFDFNTAITADTTVYAKWTESVTPGTIYYTVVSGANSTWTEGDIVITVKRSEDDEHCIDYFTGVKIDDKDLVSGTDYTSIAGSTVVSIKASTLEKLSKGGHTITVVFKDGTAATSITLKDKASGTNTSGSRAVPRTGETTSKYIGAAVLCVVVSGALFGVVLFERKKRKYAQ